MSKVQKFLPMVVTLGLLASGCGGMNVARDYSLRNESNSGLIVFSVTFETFRHNNFDQTQNADDFDTQAVLVYRQLRSNQQKYIDAYTFKDLRRSAQQWDRDLNIEGINGQLFAIELPAGDYEFIHSEVAAEGNMRHPDERFQPEFSVPFAVEAGKAVYLGDISCSVVANFLPSGGPFELVIWKVRSVTVNVKDSYDRDIELFTNRFVNIKRTQIVKSLISAPVKQSAQ